jgi:hypothetical protein
MAWTVHYLDLVTNRETKSTDAPSREAAIDLARDLQSQDCEVRRIMGPNGVELHREAIFATVSMA